MDRVAHFIVNRSRVVLALTAALTLLSVAMLFRLSFNADVSSFLLEGNPRGEEFATLQEKYQTTDPINVLASLPDGESFLEPARLADLASLRDEVLAVDGVVAVAAMVPETNPLTGQPLDPATVASLPPPVVRTLIDQSPVSELLLSADTQHALLIVTPNDDPTGTARRVTQVQSDVLDLAFSGNPVVFATVLELLSLFLLLIPPVVIALLLAVFYSTIGELRLSALVIVPAALGSLWTFGLIFALGIEIDIVTVIVPIFIIVMGSADGLHFVTHFQHEAERTSDKVEQVSSALRQVGVPMILTTISTAAGFLSLLVTDVSPIRQLGLFTAVGISFAGAISFFSLPALLTHVPIHSRHEASLLGARVTELMRSAVRSRRPAVVLTVAILAFAAVGLPRLEVNPDQLFFFKDDDPVRTAFERTEEIFGGATPLSGEFVFDSSDPAGSLVRARSASDQLEELGGVRTVFSAADLADALPAEQLDAVLAGDAALPVGDLVSDDGLRFILLPASFTTSDLEAWLEFAADSPDVRVLTGMPVVWDEIARLVLRAQATSLVAAFALVAVMLAAAYRRLRETAVALAPIAMTVLTVLGFLALSGIQLNLLTAVVSSIVIGVGIDYAIHYIAAIDHARGEGDGYVLRAIDRAGRPIIANALGIAVALTALWFSPLKIHGQVSIIMWVAMLTAAAASIMVIAALLPRAGVTD